MRDLRALAKQRYGDTKLITKELLLRWIGPGVWLVMLFYVTIALVIMSLSAHQLQHKIRQIQINGKPVAISNVKNFAEEWAQIKNNEEILFKNTRDNDSNGSKLKTQLTDSNNYLKEYKAALNRNTTEIEKITKKKIEVSDDEKIEVSDGEKKEVSDGEKKEVSYGKENNKRLKKLRSRNTELEIKIKGANNKKSDLEAQQKKTIE